VEDLEEKNEQGDVHERSHPNEIVLWEVLKRSLDLEEKDWIRLIILLRLRKKRKGKVEEKREGERKGKGKGKKRERKGKKEKEEKEEKERSYSFFDGNEEIFPNSLNSIIQYEVIKC